MLRLFKSGLHPQPTGQPGRSLSMAAYRQSGFTLLELLTAVAVTGILVAVAAPSFSSMLQNARLSKSASPVHSALFRARSEAVKSSRDITVCPLASSETCGTDWSRGLMVFVDSTLSAGDTLAVRDEADVVLDVGEQIPSTITMSVFASDDRTAAGLFVPNFISFNAQGQSNWQNGSVVFCDDRGVSNAQVVNVLLTGDIRNTVSNGDTLVDVFGRDVVCP